jgi:hypothetical protein
VLATERDISGPTTSRGASQTPNTRSLGAESLSYTRGMEASQTIKPVTSGVYRIRITAGGHVDNGVVILRDGCFDGGSAGSIYQGLFVQDGDKLSVKLTIIDWDPQESPVNAYGPSGPPSVISMTGSSGEGTFHLTGKGRSSAVVEVSGRLVAALTMQRR